MGYEVILRAGKLARHALGVLLLCWRRMIRVMLVTGGVGALVGLIFGAIEAHRVFPGMFGVIAAAFFGAVVGYSAAATVLIDELLKGMLDIVSVIEGDAEAGVRSLAAGAEHERGAILRFFDPKPRARTGPIEPAPFVPGIVATAAFAPRDPAHETRQDIADTEDFSSTAPRPRVNARPVRADLLPRIEWQYETQHPSPNPAPESTWDMPTIPTIPTKEPAAVPAQPADAPANNSEPAAQ
ncbi:MAG: hypothetical protein ACRDHE_06670 [Ktedonobacterales bacterium]